MEEADKLLKELIQETEQKAEPHMRFTANVMDTLKTQQAERAKPLIGKWMWLFLGLIFSGIFALFLFIPSDQISWPQWIPDFDQISFSLNGAGTPIILSAVGLSIIGFDEIWRRRKKAPLSSKNDH